MRVVSTISLGGGTLVRVLATVVPVHEGASAGRAPTRLGRSNRRARLVERELATEALDDPVVRRLMTIPGVDAIDAISIVGAVGDFSRFTSPDKLVS
jgi:transposase